MTAGKLACSPCLLSAVLSLTVFTGTPPVFSQDYFELVDVPVVDVDVVVTDRRDRPIKGLQLEDFTLLVDGQEQEIAFFSAPASTGDSKSEVVPDDAHLVILFDNNGVEARARNAVITQLRKFVGQGIAPNLKMMVAAAGLSGLEVHQELTSDPELVDSALSHVAETVTRDRQVAEYEHLLLEIQRLSGVRDPTQRQLRMRALTLTSQIQAFSDGARQETEITGGHLWQLVEVLAGLPGKKAVLFVGGAMSISPGEALFAALREALTRTADVGAHQAAADLPAGISTGGGEAVEALARAASVHQVVLYSIVVGGTRQMASSGGSAGSMDTQDSSSSDPSSTWAPGLESSSRMEVETALTVLAASTGGFLHSGGRKLPEALERLQAELANTYSLGFSPAGGSDDELHRISVAVAGKKLQVRHRQAFRVRGWDQETAARVASSLHFGGSENPLSVGLEVWPAETKSEVGQRVSLRVQVPLSSIALEPLEGLHRGQISVFMVAGAGRFRTAPARKIVLPVVLSNDELMGAMGQIAEHRLDFDIPEGTTRIAVGVRDDLDTRLSTLTVDLPNDQATNVPAEPAVGSGARSDSTSAASLRLPTAALVMSGQNGGPIELILEATLERAAGDLWRVPVEVRWKLPSNDQPSTLDLFAYALSEDGSTAAKDSRVVAVDSSNEDPVVAEEARAILPLELTAGQYMIRVAARERGSSEFGVAGMEIDVPGPGAGQAHWTSSRSTDSQSVVSVLPRRSETEVPRDKMTREEIAASYRKVLRALSEEDQSAARDALRAMESSQTGGASPHAVIDLAKMEGRVLMSWAQDGWDQLLPFAVLYGEMIDDYRRRLQGPLSEHAILMSTELAEEMVRRAESPESRREAADLLTSLAGYFLYSQRLRKTEELLDLAVKSDSHNAVALMALAATREQRGDYDAALDVLEAVLEISPDSGEALLRSGVNLARTGKHSEAADSLRLLLKTPSEDWVAQVATQELARALTELGETGEATRVLESAAKKWPEQPSLRIQLAWLLDQTRRSSQASDWVMGLASDSPQATESARYRYIQWYQEGLDEMRRNLNERSAGHARVLSQRLDSQSEETVGQ